MYVKEFTTIRETVLAIHQAGSGRLRWGNLSAPGGLLLLPQPHQEQFNSRLHEREYFPEPSTQRETPSTNPAKICQKLRPNRCYLAPLPPKKFINKFNYLSRINLNLALPRSSQNPKPLNFLNFFDDSDDEGVSAFYAAEGA